MPRAKWDIDASDVDNFDRSTANTLYTGPTPEDAAYLWVIKNMKRVAGDGKKLPQLRVGLELEPRDGYDDSFSEEKYRGYFRMAFLHIGESTKWKWIPFLDAIGVTGREFANGTVYDQEGNIRKIGKWRMTGEELIIAQLKTGQDEKGNDRKEIGTFGAVPEEYYGDEDAEDEDGDYYEED